MRAIKDMFTGPTLNNYKDWLIRRYNLKTENKKYSKLFTVLLTSPFLFKNVRDRNRARDGLDLREDFMQENGIPIDGRLDEKKTECSMFEMMLALSERVDNEYIGDPLNPEPKIFFWELIQNLSLDEFTNDKYDSDKVIFILDQMYADRRNMFLMRGSKEEIWTQMLAYISTKY